MKSKKIKTKKEIHLAESLRKITEFKREKHYPEVHEVHKKYHISKKTLFYVKEYGKNANVSKTIIRESLKILLLASIISSFGGLALEQIKTLFLSITPLLILLPSLNNMIGNYGTIISSRFSTMLHEGEIKGKWRKNKELKKLFFQMTIMTVVGAVLSSLIVIGITYFSGGILLKTALKVFFIVLFDMFLLTNVLFFVAIRAGIYIYKKKEDPNNFLIPVSTSIADFTNMVILALLIILLF
ncbi:MAG TPA: magnesium transporter [Bacillota bacterium]|nr:magnesium transporter [Bacillota bacterium]